MTSSLSGKPLTVQELKRIADEKETEKVKDVLGRRKKEGDEENRARQDFMEREIRPDGIERFNGWIRRAAEQGRNEIEILRFSSQYCSDHGRAINNFEEGWPDTLTGAARRVYDAYVQHLQGQGYKIRAQILNYPEGGLGEVGIYIGWYPLLRLARAGGRGCGVARGAASRSRSGQSSGGGAAATTSATRTARCSSSS